jgi:PPOX class probable F420-dependent enzyme
VTATVRPMAYSAMNRDEWLAFLQSPVRPALLATVRSNGSPHVSPIWYDIDGDTIVFNTSASSVKGRNIRRDGRVSLCVQDEQPPFSFVMVEGSATWSDHLPEVRRWAGRIGGRYMGLDRADEFGDRNGVPGELLIRVALEHVVARRDVAD